MLDDVCGEEGELLPSLTSALGRWADTKGWKSPDEVRWAGTRDMVV